jgi:4-oxalocrotonate tautomerase
METPEGRTDEMKKELIKKVSEVAADVLKITLEHVQCILTEVPRKHWARGRVPYSERKLEGEGYKFTK